MIEPRNRAGEADPKALVRAGYDVISHRYRPDDGESPFPYQSFLDELMPLIEPRDAVLDLGCGCGVPVARDLADRFDVTGVDISSVQIERARSLVPLARFIRADMARVELPAGGFAAVVSFYALIHVPVEEHLPILRRIRHWLRTGGHFLGIVGAQTWTGIEDYLGAPMYWSHADAPTYRRWLHEAGFARCWDRFVPEGSSGHTLLLARAE